MASINFQPSIKGGYRDRRTMAKGIMNRTVFSPIFSLNELWINGQVLRLNFFVKFLISALKKNSYRIVNRSSIFRLLKEGDFFLEKPILDPTNS